MIWVQALIALAVALLMGIAFVAIAGWRRPQDGDGAGWWTAMLFFVAVVFFASWAAGAWIRPVGPPFNGVYWVGILLVGLLVALLLASAVPPRRWWRRGEPPEREEASRMAGLGLFFWVFLTLLVILVGLAYTG